MAECGVNGSLGPLPSDPNSPSVLNAVVVRGGIRVSWGYPTVNPNAVGYIDVFTHTTNNVATAAKIATVTGNQYFDQKTENDNGVTFFYWIQMVSINGTVLPMVGPAQATMVSITGQDIASISGQINASSLAASLRSQIEDIPSLRADLINEETGRLASIDNLVLQLNALGVDITTTVSAILDERTQRIAGQDVLTQSVQGVVASNGTNAAAIVQENLARVSATDALSQSLTTAVARVATAEGAITNNAIIAANATGAVATQVNTLETTSINSFRQATAPTAADGRKVGSLWVDTANNAVVTQWDGSNWVALENQTALLAFAGVQSIQQSISQGDFALASEFNTFEASVTTAGGVTYDAIQGAQQDVDDLAIDVPIVATAKAQDAILAAVGYCVFDSGPNEGQPVGTAATATQATCVAAGHKWLAMREISQAVLGVQIDDGENTLKLQQSMSAFRTDMGDLQGEYTVKLQQSGSDTIIGGFGLATTGPNGSPTVSAHFDVTTFSVGELGNTELPFIVDNGDVYIRKARIKDADIDTLKIAGESVSVTKSINYAICNIIDYDTTTSTGKVRWGLDGSNSGTQSLVNATTDTTLYNPFGTITVGGLSSDVFQLVINGTMNVGIKSRSTSTTVSLSFQPFIQIYKDGILYEQAELLAVRTTCGSCTNNPLELIYSTTYKIAVDGDAVYTYRILFEKTYYKVDGWFSSGAWGSEYNANYLHYCWARNPTYTATLYKR